MKHSRLKGSTLILVLVFGSIFFTVLTALSSYVLIENRAEEVRRQHQEAIAIAEAGLEYYRWFLSHFPGDIENGTGQPGPYEIDFNDPESGVAGTYTLAITGSSACGSTSSVTVTSIGEPTDAPGRTATLWARYAQPSVAQYSFILNSSVWIGSTIFGPFHSNGGIRMDGISSSPVTSSVATWSCTGSFGCSPTQTKNGVWGAGVDQNLWEFPTPQTDFAGISADFGVLEDIAEADGLHFPRYSSGSSGNNFYRGYHLVFNANGSISVYRVSSENTVSAVQLSNSGAGLQTEYSLINAEALFGTYTPDSDCPVIFVEDNVWVEGTISEKVTLVVANVDDAGITPRTWLRNNIQYVAYDGSDGLSLLSEGDLLIAPNAPTDLTLNGIFVSQAGAFGMNLYTCANPSYAGKDDLIVLGTIVSNLRPGTYWTYSGYGCGSNQHSGYPDRTISFDRQNSTDPPPFTPVTSTQYQFVDWREQ